MQPGRNAPCPCGSGKKYKRCCASKDENHIVEAMPQDEAAREYQEESLDPEFGEFLLNAMQRLRGEILSRHAHIHAYHKIRKMHGEIVDAMIRYYDDGKFEQEMDLEFRFPDTDSSELHLLNATFDPQTRAGVHCFYDMLVYKPALNMNCITEVFLQRNRYRKPEKITFLHSMLNSKLGLFEITSTDMNEGYAYLRDVFTGVKYRIVDVALSGDIHYADFYLYTRIIEYQGICFGTGLNLVFAKSDPFIKRHIQKYAKNFSPQGEFVRFIELHNRYSQDHNGVSVIPYGID